MSEFVEENGTDGARQTRESRTFAVLMAVF